MGSVEVGYREGHAMTGDAQSRSRTEHAVPAVGTAVGRDYTGPGRVRGPSNNDEGEDSGVRPEASSAAHHRYCQAKSGHHLDRAGPPTLHAHRGYQQSLGFLFLRRHPLSRTDPTSATELIWVSTPSGRRSMAPRRACSALTFWGTDSTPEVPCGFDFATSDPGFSRVHSATSLLGTSWVRECSLDCKLSPRTCRRASFGVRQATILSPWAAGP